MVTGQFGTLIQELADTLGYNINIQVDDQCGLPLPNGMIINMEIDENQEFFVLNAVIGNIPIGRYREDIFREAMLYNGLGKRVGVFSYSEVDDEMILFRNLPLTNLTGQIISDALIPLGEKAASWKKAISLGELPPAELSTPTSGAGIGGLMGLKP